jgi:hypothetical protein
VTSNGARPDWRRPGVPGEGDWVLRRGALIGFHGVGVQGPVESVDGEGHGAARGAGEVSAFSVDPADGSLTAITGVSELASGYAGLVAV